MWWIQLASVIQKISVAYTHLDVYKRQFQLTDIGFDVGCDIFDHFIINIVAFHFFFFTQDGHAGLIIRRLDVYSKTPFKAGTQTFFQSFNFFRRFIGRYDNLLL